MPDGYDWLGRASWPTETHRRWVILTGAATVKGQETDAFRLPDELESRLIDVTISINPAPSGVYEMPPSRYHDILHEPDLQAEGTCRWTSPHDNIIASAWATETDETVRWLDSIAVEAGSPGPARSQFLVSPSNPPVPPPAQKMYQDSSVLDTPRAFSIALSIGLLENYPSFFGSRARGVLGRHAEPPPSKR